MVSEFSTKLRNIFSDGDFSYNGTLTVFLFIGLS